MVRKFRLIPEEVFEKIQSFKNIQPSRNIVMNSDIINSKLPDDAKLILCQENARNQYQKRLNKESQPILVKNVSLENTLDLLKKDLGAKNDYESENDHLQSEKSITHPEVQESNSKSGIKRKAKLVNEESIPSEKRKKGRPPKQKRSVFDDRICPDNTPFYAKKFTKVEPHLLVKRSKVVPGSKRERRSKDDKPNNEQLWEDYQDRYLQSEPKKPKTSVDLKRKNAFKMTSLKRLQTEADQFVIKKGVKNMNPVLLDEVTDPTNSGRKSKRSTKGINRWTPYTFK